MVLPQKLIVLIDVGVYLEKAVPAHKHKKSAKSLRESSGSTIGASVSSLNTLFPGHETRQIRVEYDGGTPWKKLETPSSVSSPSQGHHVRSLFNDGFDIPEGVIS